MIVRLLLVIALALSMVAQAADGPPDPDKVDIWLLVRNSLFGNRPIADDAGEVVSLRAPARAQDASTVPIAISTRIEQTPERYVSKVYLIIDKNPSPVAAVFGFTPDSGRADIETRVRVEDVAAGDEVVVYPGELITVDGTVLTGRATVDQKILTGESMPVEKGPGDLVYAATVVRDGKLYVQASKVGEETMVANVVHMIRDSPARETRAQNYAEHFADRVVPWSFIAAGGSFLATGQVHGAAALLIIDYGMYHVTLSGPPQVAGSQSAGHGSSRPNGSIGSKTFPVREAAF